MKTTTRSSWDHCSTDNEGILDLSFRNLNDGDLKRILTRLGSSGPENDPGKCLQEAQDELDPLIAGLSSSKRFWKLRFAGNPAIGDDGMRYLPLIPDTVRDLDFADCNLSCEGIKTFCQFLVRNKTITRANLGGNGMNDEAATVVGLMLSKNDRLEELCIDPRISVKEEDEGTQISWIAAIRVCMGLYQNRTLRHLHFIVPNSSAIDEGIWYLIFAKMLRDDSPLEILECGNHSTFDNPPTFLCPLLEMVRQKWLLKLGRNQQLYSIGGGLLKMFPENKTQYYLDLNKCNARRIVSEPNFSTSEWLDAVTCASKEHKLNTLYYLIRHKPEVCKW